MKKKTRKDYIKSLTEDREFQLTGGRWVSGGVDKFKLDDLKQIYKGSRKKTKKSIYD